MNGCPTGDCSPLTFGSSLRKQSDARPLQPLNAPACWSARRSLYGTRQADPSLTRASDGHVQPDGLPHRHQQVSRANRHSVEPGITIGSTAADRTFSEGDLRIARTRQPRFANGTQGTADKPVRAVTTAVPAWESAGRTRDCTSSQSATSPTRGGEESAPFSSSSGNPERTVIIFEENERCVSRAQRGRPEPGERGTERATASNLRPISASS